MALTLKAEQRLEAASLVELFEQHQEQWTAAAKRTYDFIQTSFPKDASVRPDDVAKALMPILEVDDILRNKLAEDKLRQKYWISDFTDLIIERVWSKLH